MGISLVFILLIIFSLWLELEPNSQTPVPRPALYKQPAALFKRGSLGDSQSAFKRIISKSLVVFFIVYRMRNPSPLFLQFFPVLFLVYG